MPLRWRAVVSGTACIRPAHCCFGGKPALVTGNGARWAGEHSPPADRAERRVAQPEGVVPDLGAGLARQCGSRLQVRGKPVQAGPVQALPPAQEGPRRGDGCGRSGSGEVVAALRRQRRSSEGKMPRHFRMAAGSPPRGIRGVFFGEALGTPVAGRCIPTLGLGRQRGGGGRGGDLQGDGGGLLPRGPGAPSSSGGPSASCTLPLQGAFAAASELGRLACWPASHARGVQASSLGVWASPARPPARGRLPKLGRGRGCPGACAQLAPQWQRGAAASTAPRDSQNHRDWPFKLTSAQQPAGLGPRQHQPRRVRASF